MFKIFNFPFVVIQSVIFLRNISETVSDGIDADYDSVQVLSQESEQVSDSDQESVSLSSPVTFQDSKSYSRGVSASRTRRLAVSSQVEMFIAIYLTVRRERESKGR